MAYLDVKKISFLNVWQYEDGTGVQRNGAMLGFSDFGGSDITYRYHRLDESGNPIIYANGGIALDLVSGYRLKAAKRIGNKPNPLFIPA